MITRQWFKYDCERLCDDPLFIHQVSLPLMGTCGSSRGVSPFQPSDCSDSARSHSSPSLWKNSRAAPTFSVATKVNNARAGTHK